MAGLIQDSNTNATYGHSAAAMKKGGLTFSGRKPLGDLSNSGNPFLKKASEKMVTKKNFAVIEEAVIEEEIGARAKKNISRGSDTGTRKALSDISNSNRNQTSKKKQNTKLTAVTEEPFHEKAIADERFLHNHQECIKAQHQAMDMDHFLKTVGLANNGFPKDVPSLKRPASPPRFLEEMLEHPISDRSAKKFDYSSPKSPDHYEFWKDRNDCISFNLLDTPKLVKH